MAGNIDKIVCLICSSGCCIQNKVEKLDVIFLLRILLEIPQDSQLIDRSKISLKFVNICDPCEKIIKECKKIYEKICEEIQKFREKQNIILERFSTIVTSANEDDVVTTCIKDNNRIWVNECRKFVKNHNLTGFKRYPFIVHDLETLFNCASPAQSTDDLSCPLKSEVATCGSSEFVEFDDHSIPISEDPLYVSPCPASEEDAPNTPLENDDPLSVKEEPETEKEDDDNYEQDMHLSEESVSEEDSNDSDYKPSASKKARKTVRRTRTSNRHHPEDANFSRVDDDATGEGKEENESQDKQLSSTKSKSKKIVKKNKSKVGNKTGGLAKRKSRKYEIEDIYNCVKNPSTNKFHCTWPDCSKNYWDKQGLISHMDRHNGTPRLKCTDDKCDNVFYSKCQLERHEQKEHLGGKISKPFECDICGERFSCQGDVYGHKTLNHSTKAVLWKICEVCGKRIAGAGLKKHMKNVHGEIERNFRCHLCPLDFVREDRLKMHLYRRHEIWGSEKERVELEKKRERRLELSRKWKCPVAKCRMGFMREKGLKNHMEEKHGGNWGDQEGKVEGDRYRFICGVCGKGFHYNGKLKEHEVTHVDKEKRNKPFKCEICGKGFARMSFVRGHMVVHEEREKKWRCEVCKVGFVEERLLEKHWTSQHHKWRVEREVKGEMKRECEFCGKRFKNGRDVGMHKRLMHKDQLN